MSNSYCIVRRSLRQYVIVNGGPYWDHVDTIIDIKPHSRTRDIVEVFDYYEGVERKWLDDGPPYETRYLIFTADKWSVVTATYMRFERGLVMDDVMDELEYESAMSMARLVLSSECVRNDLPKAVEVSVKTSKWGKEKEDEEICPICHEEYHPEDMIGTLSCNHTYHKECIISWMMKNTMCPDCPLCRTEALFFNP